MRPPANTPYESHEYRRLVERGFRPYSRGHRAMYLTAIDRLKKLGTPVSIFEAGFGIGYGLDEMLAAGIVERYFGCEPNLESFRYVMQRHGHAPRIDLVEEPFASATGLRGAPYDAAFCIEVIEHVPMHEHEWFLRCLRDRSPRLFLSTPDSRKSSEGVRTMGDWLAILQTAGWERIDVDTSHWTYLYDCRGH